MMLDERPAAAAATQTIARRRRRPSPPSGRVLPRMRRGEVNWKRWGPYLSERQWGTVREDYSAGRRRLGLLPARPRAQPRLSLGRGRPRRHLRRPAAALPRAGAVERPRPDPQGAAVRPDQRRGQPRRGRQGALLLPRRHADALVPEDALQVSAARSFPTRELVEENRRRGRDEPEFELLDTGVFDDDRYFDVFVEYAKAGPDDILMRITVHNRGPEAAPTPRAAAALVPQHLVVDAKARRSPRCRRGRRRDRASSIATLRRLLPVLPTARPSCCSARTRRTSRGCSACRRRRRLLQGRLPRVRRRRPARRGQPGATRHQGGGALSTLDVPAGGSATRPAAARRARCRRRRSPTSTRSSTQRRAEADEFYAELQADIDDADARLRAAPGVRRA